MCKKPLKPLKSTVFTCARLLKFLGCLVKEKKYTIKYLIAFLKTLTSSKDCSENGIRISVLAFLFLSQAAFWIPIIRLSESRNKLPEEGNGKIVLELVSDFIEASRTFIKRGQKKCENHHRSKQKYTNLIFRNVQKIWIS